MTTRIVGPEVSGIYQIRNGATGKLYIGSAVNMQSRWREHIKSLRAGNHHSRHLQSSWSKHGEAVFAFEPIEFCDRENLIEREQAAFDSLSPAYNICKFAGSSLGREHSKETRQKIAERARGRPSFERTPEYCQKLSELHKGRQKPAHVMEALQAGRARRVYTDEQRAAISVFMTGRDRPKSVEHREKLSAALRGRPLSEETKQKISAALSGRTRGDYKPWSEEAKARARDARRSRPNPQKGVKRSAETIAKMSAANMGKTLSEETRAAMSAAGKARWADPVKRAETLASRAAKRMLKPKAVKQPVERKPPQGGWKVPQEIRDRMSESKKGKKWTDAQRAARSRYTGKAAVFPPEKQMSLL